MRHLFVARTRHPTIGQPTRPGPTARGLAGLQAGHESRLMDGRHWKVFVAIEGPIDLVSGWKA
jgi:hypothetical protein